MAKVRWYDPRANKFWESKVEVDYAPNLDYPDEVSLDCLADVLAELDRTQASGELAFQQEVKYSCLKRNYF